jgi:hypothetical protein
MSPFIIIDNDDQELTQTLIDADDKSGEENIKEVAIDDRVGGDASSAAQGAQASSQVLQAGAFRAQPLSHAPKRPRDSGPTPSADTEAKSGRGTPPHTAQGANNMPAGLPCSHTDCERLLNWPFASASSPMRGEWCSVCQSVGMLQGPYRPGEHLLCSEHRLPLSQFSEGNLLQWENFSTDFNRKYVARGGPPRKRTTTIARTEFVCLACFCEIHKAWPAVR